MARSQPNRPPRTAEWLLALCPLGDDRALLEADIRELFDERCHRDGRRAAGVRFWHDVLSLWTRQFRRGVQRRAATSPVYPRASPILRFKLLLGDLRYAARLLTRTPVSSVVSITILALGIGGALAAFSLINAVLIRQVPLAHSDRLVVLDHRDRQHPEQPLNFSLPEIRDLRVTTRTLEWLGEYERLSVTLIANDVPDRVNAGAVSIDTFQQLGITPILGDLFDPSARDSGSPLPLVITERYWRQRFGSDPGCLGSRVSVRFQMTSAVGRIVGIVAEHTSVFDVDEVYVPIDRLPHRYMPGFVDNRDMRSARLFGRRGRLATTEEVNAELRVISGAFASRHRENYRPSQSISAIDLREHLNGDLPARLWLIASATLCVLLLACANVAMLTIARMQERRREFQIRAAIGASRARIAAQVLTESCVLSALAGGLALTGLIAGLGVVRSYAIRYSALATAAELDLRIVLTTIAVALATGVLTAIGVLVDARVAGPPATARRQVRTRLVGMQIALTVALLLVAGLMVRTVMRLLAVPAGVDDQHVVAVSIGMDWPRYPEPRLRAFQDALLERLEQAPNVSSAAMVLTVPFTTGEDLMTVATRTSTIQDEPLAESELRIVSRGFFSTLGIPLLAGRGFSPEDGAEGAPVAVVNATWAARQFGSGHESAALGKDVTVCYPSMPGFCEPPMRIIGVTGDVRHYGPDRAVASEVYQPLAQSPTGGHSLLIRSSEPLPIVRQRVQRILHDIDPHLPVFDITMVRALRDAHVAPRRSATALLGILAAIAFAVTSAGLAGSTVQGVIARRRELGVRLALGASPACLQQMILGEVTRVVTWGTLAGCLIAAAASRTLVASGWLWGVRAFDPVACLAVASLVFLCGVGAASIAARRIAAIEPRSALTLD